jgi:transposase InsO family protein
MILLGKLEFIFYSKNQKLFMNLKAFKAHVENETGKIVKTLRTDRGGEYCSTELKVFCADHGIRRELTVAYTP